MGKNKKPKSIGRLLIDLTPLLDVIFIVLIVVLAGRDSMNANTDQKKADAEQKYMEASEYVSEADQKLDEMQTKVNMYESQVSAYEYINEHFNFVNVYASYSLENRKIRTIYIMINNEAPVTINLTPSNTAEAWTKCKKMIEDVIEKDESIPLFLSLNSNDDEKTLYRDDEAIYSMYKDLKAAHPDIISIR